MGATVSQANSTKCSLFIHLYEMPTLLQKELDLYVHENKHRRFSNHVALHLHLCMSFQGGFACDNRYGIRVRAGVEGYVSNNNDESLVERLFYIN
jgi:hypothetical protein